MVAHSLGPQSLPLIKIIATMTEKITYSEKLKDPRWQKKRLEILNRDKFTCQNCGDETKTLHVHHKLYIHGCEPWDYEDKYLLTLCYSCHEDEEVAMKENIPLLINAVKRSPFMAADLLTLGEGIEEVKLFHLSGVIAHAIKYLLTNDKLLRDLVLIYSNRNPSQKLPF